MDGVRLWSRLGWFFAVLGLLLMTGIDWDILDGGSKTKWERSIMLDISFISSLFCFGVSDILEAIGKETRSSED